MQKTRFTESQIVATIKKQESGMPVKEIWIGGMLPLFTNRSGI